MTSVVAAADSGSVFVRDATIETGDASSSSVDVPLGKFFFYFSVNSGTHMVHFGVPRPCFLSKLYDNVINMRNDQISMGLVFLEDFIFLVKKIF